MVSVPIWVLVLTPIIISGLVMAVIAEDVRRREARRDSNYQSWWISTNIQGTDYHINPDDVAGKDR